MGFLDARIKSLHVVPPPKLSGRVRDSARNHEATLKRWTAKIFATIALSLAVYTFFYIKTPDAPLGPAEIGLVVGTCLALVLSVEWLWHRFGKKGAGK